MIFVRFSYQGRARLGVVADGAIYELLDSGRRFDSLQELVLEARRRNTGIDDLAGRLLQSGDCAAFSFHAFDVFSYSTGDHLLAPVEPAQVWAAAFTYAPPPGWNKYEAERKAKRPILFFKGTSSHCVGPNDYIGIRGDSSHTIPEPELAVILDEDGNILAYTIANDVTALDFTNKSPLYVSYSKTYRRSLALGPVAVTPGSIGDARTLAIRITISRNGVTIVRGESNTSAMLISIDELISYTLEHNSLAVGTVLCTGGGIWLPFDFTLQPDDAVEIEIEGIGVLRNIARKV